MVSIFNNVDYGLLGAQGAYLRSLQAGEQLFRYLAAAGFTLGTDLHLIVCQLTADGELPQELSDLSVNNGSQYTTASYTLLRWMQQFATNRGGDAVPERDRDKGGAYRTVSLRANGAEVSATFVVAVTGDKGTINRAVADTVLGVVCHCWHERMQVVMPPAAVA